MYFDGVNVEKEDRDFDWQGFTDRICMLEYNVGQLTGEIAYLGDKFRCIEADIEENKNDATTFTNHLGEMCREITCLFKKHFEDGDVDISEDELIEIISNYTF